MPELLTVKNLSKRFDGVTALDGFSCRIKKYEIVGLIGPNGAGKTTLFNIITGFLRPDSGSIVFEDGSAGNENTPTKDVDLVGLPPHKVARLGIARTFQYLRLIRQVSVLENVMLWFPRQPGEDIIKLFFAPKKVSCAERENLAKARDLLKFSGLETKMNDPAEALSYGQQKLLSITCCLASGADLLLLDEPIAGIAPEMIERILSIIADLPEKGKTVVLIEHNIDAVMQVSDRIIFMDSGRLISDGVPFAVRSDPRVIEAYLD